MNGQVETSGHGGIGAFPPDWGMPEGSTFSAERAAWVFQSVRKHMALEEARDRHRTDPKVALRLLALSKRRAMRRDWQR